MSDWKKEIQTYELHLDSQRCTWGRTSARVSSVPFRKRLAESYGQAELEYTWLPPRARSVVFNTMQRINAFLLCHVIGPNLKHVPVFCMSSVILRLCGRRKCFTMTIWYADVITNITTKGDMKANDGGFVVNRPVFNFK